MFTRRPGSSLYTLATEPPQVAASAQVSASGPVAPPCSCRLLSPRLRGMHSRLLVSGLPRSLLPLPPLPAPPCLPCVEGRQRAAPHSSSFPSTTAPLQTLHMDDLPVLRLHSDRGGEFSSALLRGFCRGEGILLSFTLLAFPQQNGIAERRIGLLMEVARTSMIHAAAPHFLWSFAVRYAAHQLNLWPRVSLPKTSSTLRWTGKVGDALAFWGIKFDESVLFYRLFPYRSAPLPTPPLFLAPDPLPSTVLVEVAVDSGAAPGVASRGAASGGAEPARAELEGAEPAGAEPGVAKSEGAGFGGAEPGGSEPAGVEPRGAEPEGVEPGGAEMEGAESGGAEPQGAASSGGPAPARAGGAGVTAGAGGTRGTAVTGPRGARARGTGAAGTGGVGGAGAGDHTEPGTTGAGGSGAGGARAGGAGAGGTGAGVAGAVDPGGTVRPRPYFIPRLQQRREPASRPILPVRTARRIPCSRPPPVPGTHAITLRPSSVPLRVPLPAPLKSSLPAVLDPEFDRARATSPTGSCLLATAITDTSFESAATSTLVAELLEFAAACCLDYATALVAESSFASPPSVGGESALGTDVLEDRQEDFECLAAAVPCFSSMQLAPEGDPDAPDIPTPLSYAEAITVPPCRANIVDGIWIFSVKWPPGSPPAFKVRYIARGFSQRQRGNLHEEIWLRRSPGFTRSFPAGTEWSLRRPFYGLRQAPREWHDTLRTTLAALGFAPSTADPSLFLRTDTSLPPFFVLVYVDDLVFATADTEITRDRARRTITLTQSHMVHQVLQRFGFQFSSPQPTPRTSPLLARYVVPDRHRKVHWDAAKKQRGQLRLTYVATRANTADIFTKALQSGDHLRFSTVLGLVLTLPRLLTT
ncbi:unnamed protein product [Closterium sp. NIES-53]